MNGDNGCWPGLALSRQRVQYRVTPVPDPDNLKAPKLKYGAITAMPELLNSSFDELRLAYYFDNLMVRPKRSWETPTPLSAPVPNPSQSTLASTAVLTTIPPASTPVSTQTENILVANDQASTGATELKPTVQALAALGLNSQPGTPAADPLRGGPERPTQPGLLSFPRSPAAERIPVVNIAETDWEAARRAVAWRKTLLEKAQAEYDEAVKTEKQKFKVYIEARTSFDK
ncbi:hypothetical protein FRC01_007725 [Tulasnella sp. 417]|nr:hypothetical protein FRC01_007725 [Tulasnella sp. 417]